MNSRSGSAALLAGALLALVTPAASAQCSASDGIVTCTGNPGPISFAQGYPSLTVSQLTQFITQPAYNQAAISLTATATSGGENQNGFGSIGLAINFAGSPYGLQGNGSGMFAATAGGNGGTGKPGDLAGSGGNAGAIAIGFASGTVTTVTPDSYGLIVRANGGSGGNGSEFHKYFLNGHGGDAGGGGAGGDITIGIISGTFKQTGSAYGAMIVQSLGGAGGNAGYTEATGGAAYGGAGGAGGGAGNIALAFGTATLAATSVGPGAVVLAQSFGANGGNGGEGYSDVADAHGGAGGAGGGGGSISVVSGTTAYPGTLSITTAQAQQHAIEAVSTGGSGGTGGFGHAGTIKGFGGDGGVGATGGGVTVNLAGAAIATAGAQSLGIFARTYGGAGGNGGEGKGGSGHGGADLGGGPGGAVNVTFSGTLATGGSEANGIFAQSVGGFSGNGGSASGFVAYGASDQSAGNGGSVGLTVLGSTSSVVTTGDSATALTAQSVGGGGGKGSSAGGVGALGGTGAAGGSGGVVSVQNEATLTTSGNGAVAISAGSQGGGGGDAGAARGVVALGGASGAGGNGGQATVVNGATGAIQTKGGQADGIVATSIGGGGGSAHSTSGIVAIGGTGGNGGSGATAAVQNDASIATQGADADGAVVQSVGQGGGSGSNAIAVSVAFSLAIGGKGGAGGAGGDASYNDSGNGGYTIETTGDRARGVFVQSQGGGGGDAGNAISVAAVPLATVAVAVGGAGGGGGSAATASASLSGGVSTQGTNADALHVASVGGGGGHSGTTVAAAQGGFVSVDTAVGGSGGNGGNGGQVSVVATGPLATTGDLSSAVRAHSAGGGGGTAGAVASGTTPSVVSVTTSVGGSGGAGGAGGAVTVATAGAITTAGHSSYGVVARSLGGGGGAADFAGAFDTASGLSVATTVGGSGGAAGDGGTIGVTTSASIGTTGHNAAAITAQSIGGRGGDAGVTVSANGVSGGNIGVTVGGNGGSHDSVPGTSTGSGGNVTVGNTATITTAGNVSDGLRAHSIANGGGTSGLVIDASAASFADIDVAVGGRAGAGGSSGIVTVTNQADITTQGLFSAGIDAKSIAGSGGNAKGTIATSGLTMGSLNSSVGGNGGAGGTAGAISVSTAGNLSTGGDLAHGIVAMSTGGAGGEGGLAVEAGLSVGEVAGSLNVSVGGSGGAGGLGGAVKVSTQGTIATAGFGSYGLVAQSIGGNGGIAGSVYSGNAAATSTGSLQMTGTWGGIGGSGAVGGTVDVTNGANIVTKGYLAVALLAQSIGGGGGAGGGVYTVAATATPGSSLTFAANHGGVGGTGNHGGKVTVLNTGTLTTQAGGGAGLAAQSIGGGGGHGGNAGAIVVTLTGGGGGNTLSSNINLGAGGSGGAGGDGDTVSVTNQGAITTQGDVARGIEAMSIGGGGGSGGAASAYSYSFNGICSGVRLAAGDNYLCKAGDGTQTAVKINAKIEIGGSGGAAGNGGEVTVDNTAAIATAGKVSHAIYAKSVGGGGGSGGEASTGLTAWTTNKIAEEVTSLGKTFTTIPGFTSVNILVGGSGGASGDGGDVSVTNAALLSTTGAHAFGIHAQSVGGGGGDGGAASEGLSGKVGIAAGGSGGGQGGSVTVSTPGAIRTTGKGGVGIFAQSIGGGGGTAGNLEKALAYSWADLNIGMGVINVQENAGAGGDGGAVSVTAGAITTSGVAAHGIAAHSVGGTGGMAGLDSGLDEANHAYDFAGSGGAAGSGGTVSITVGGAISVAGASAHGIFAQSVSGKGKDDASGNVTIDVNANVSATGAGGRAILAQSQGNAQSGNVAITVAKGVTVATGLNGAETIGIKDGASNSITNYGTLISGNTASYVIRATGGAIVTEIFNHGTITGSILGATVEPSAGEASTSRITLANLGGAIMNTGSMLDAASVRNDGTLAVGGANALAATRLTGNLVQGATGVLAIDLDPRAAGGAGAADRLAVDGHASLGGRVVVNLIDTWQPTEGPRSLSIVTAGAGLSGAALDVSHSAVAQFRVHQDTPGTLALGYDIDFANTGILAATNDNQDAVARHLHALYRRQALDPALARSLIAIADGATYAGVMNTMGIELAVDNQIASLLSAVGFGDALVNCDQRAGDLRYFGRAPCAWASLRGGELRQKATGDNVGFDANDWRVAVGGQTHVADGWSVGGALAYAHRRLSVDASSASSRGDEFQAGATAARRYGAMQLAGGLSVGYGTYDNRRQPWGGDVTTATQRMWLVSGRAQAAWLFQQASWALKPRIGVGVHYLAMDGFNDAGSNAFRVNVDSQHDTYVDVLPAVDFYTEVTTADGLLVRPQLTLGVTQFIGDAAPSVTARFADAPAAIPAFTSRTKLDSTRLDAAASVTMFATGNLSVRAEVSGSFSRNTEGYGAGLKAALAF